MYHLLILLYYCGVLVKVLYHIDDTVYQAQLHHNASQSSARDTTSDDTSRLENHAADA